MPSSKKVGQITIRKVGERFCVCIGGTPQSLHETFNDAERLVFGLRKKHGRRTPMVSSSRGKKSSRKKSRK